MTRVGVQMETTTEGSGSTSAQRKPPGHVLLPRLQLSQHVALAPPSNETQTPSRPRPSGRQLTEREHDVVQMRSPEPTTWQSKPAGQSPFVKQKSYGEDWRQPPSASVATMLPAMSAR